MGLCCFVGLKHAVCGLGFAVWGGRGLACLHTRNFADCGAPSTRRNAARPAQGVCGAEREHILGLHKGVPPPDGPRAAARGAPRGLHASGVRGALRARGRAAAGAGAGGGARGRGRGRRRVGGARAGGGGGRGAHAGACACCAAGRRRGSALAARAAVPPAALGRLCGRAASGAACIAAPAVAHAGQNPHASPLKRLPAAKEPHSGHCAARSRARAHPQTALPGARKARRRRQAARYARHQTQALATSFPGGWRIADCPVSPPARCRSDGLLRRGLPWRQQGGPAPFHLPQDCGTFSKHRPL